jgi:hypothetical protein
MWSTMSLSAHDEHSIPPDFCTLRTLLSHMESYLSGTKLLYICERKGCIVGMRSALESARFFGSILMMMAMVGRWTTFTGCLELKR